jgi:hypothetical protein
MSILICLSKNNHSTWTGEMLVNFLFQPPFVTLSYKLKTMSMSKETTARPFHKAPAQFRPWTNVDDQKLKTMIVGGKNSEEIATALGRTRASVMGRKSFLGIKQKMAPARGSLMPYTAFAKEERGTVVREAKVTIEPTSEVHVAPSKSTLGTTIDTLIQQSKDMGLRIKISFSSEDQD